MRIDSQMFDFIPKQVPSNGLTMLPPVEADHGPGARRSRHPARGARPTSTTRPTSTRRKTQTALEEPASRSRRSPSYAGRLWDYWERNLDPDLFKDRSLLGAIGGQGGPDHRRLIAASARRPRSSAPKPARRCCWSLAPREAARRPGGRSRRPAAPRYIHQCDLSDIDDCRRGWPRRCSSSTAGRHPRQQRRPLDPALGGASLRPLPRLRAHDAAQLLRRAAADPRPAARHAKRRGASAATSSTSRSIGVQTNTPRFSAYVASKAALDAWSRCVAVESASTTASTFTTHLHAAGADADDRPDQDVRRVPRRSRRTRPPR